jgi:diadenosine tetraphosphatase ApaH/serine/threonine PP2A family protein phosphatase
MLIAMRIALLSDIHANVQALDACLAHARERAVERCALRGGFVGYGADAAAVVDAAMAIAAAGGIAIRGNHDAAIDQAESYFNDDARAALDWARTTLDGRQKAFLSGLPLTERVGDILFVHASAASPERWRYIDSPSEAMRCVQAAGATYTFCGHVHDQRLYFETPRARMSAFTPVPGTAVPAHGPRRWLATVGSVGQPRDRNPAAAYAIFDAQRRQITFFRVPYDHHAAAARIRAAGLPESLAHRVESGF